jgi:hypothetical protein
MTQLPAEGRKGPAPEWPLVADIVMQVRLEQAQAKAEDLVVQIEAEEDTRTRRRLEREHNRASETAQVLARQIEASQKLERELWVQLWALPIATQWEKASFTREVAQYVRWKVQGELGDLNASKEARMLSDRLGLNPLSMLRLRMEVPDADEAPDVRTTKRTVRKPVAASKDPRQHLRALN